MIKNTLFQEFEISIICFCSTVKMNFKVKFFKIVKLYTFVFFRDLWKLKNVIFDFSKVRAHLAHVPKIRSLCTLAIRRSPI